MNEYITASDGVTYGPFESTEPFDRTRYYWADDGHGDLTLWRQPNEHRLPIAITSETELQALSPELLPLVKTGVYFTNWCHDTQQSAMSDDL